MSGSYLVMKPGGQTVDYKHGAKPRGSTIIKSSKGEGNSEEIRMNSQFRTSIGLPEIRRLDVSGTEGRKSLTTQKSIIKNEKIGTRNWPFKQDSLGEEKPPEIFEDDGLEPTDDLPGNLTVRAKAGLESTVKDHSRSSYINISNNISKCRSRDKKLCIGGYSIRERFDRYLFNKVKNFDHFTAKYQDDTKSGDNMVHQPNNISNNNSMTTIKNKYQKNNNSIQGKSKIVSNNNSQSKSKIGNNTNTNDTIIQNFDYIQDKTQSRKNQLNLIMLKKNFSSDVCVNQQQPQTGQKIYTVPMFANKSHRYNKSSGVYLEPNFN